MYKGWAVANNEMPKIDIKNNIPEKTNNSLWYRQMLEIYGGKKIRGRQP